MFKERRVVTTISYNEVISRLNGQVRYSFVTDRVDENTFSIHKSVTNGPMGDNRRFVDFWFHGTVKKIDEQTEVVYRVTPPKILLALLFVLLAIAIQSLIQVLFFQGSLLFLAASVLFPAALCWFTAWECSECVKDFESRLK